MKKQNQFAAYFVYAFMALSMFAVSRIFDNGGQYVGLYWSIAFFAVVGIDFYKTQVEDGASEIRAYACTSRAPAGVFLDPWGYLRVDYFGCARSFPASDTGAENAICSQPRSLGDNFADRFLGNLFVAPFTLPVKLYNAITR